MGFIDRYSRKFTNLATQMDLNDCIILVTVLLVIGLICMRGFGSRTDY
jgi:hypothetical protein